MNGKFTLTIELGNDAMRSEAHVVKALQEVAKTIRQSPHTVKNEGGRIRDINGNTVGSWQFEEE
jgi:hypothetical protein